MPRAPPARVEAIWVCHSRPVPGYQGWFRASERYLGGRENDGP
jgi:hypothetical protein